MAHDAGVHKRDVGLIHASVVSGGRREGSVAHPFVLREGGWQGSVTHILSLHISELWFSEVPMRVHKARLYASLAASQ